MAPAPRVITMDAPADRAVTRAVPSGKPMMTPTVTSVALVRVLFVATLAITGALWPHPTTAQTAVFYVWGLVWLPWSIAMLFISGSRHRRIAIVGGPVVD